MDRLRLDPKQLIDDRDPKLSELIQAAERLGAHVVVRLVKNPPAVAPEPETKGESLEPTHGCT